uniref:hypothetical protein n=1 Tax=Paractinoplanes polyasparticus TaxID=2856853 RepID=UPI001C85A29B|nr:hypothetical protein [Actinoplanes polyasparticus]
MSAELSEIVAALILERKKAREADHARRQKSVAEFRADHAERRRHGLVARHRAKLKGIQERLV